MRCAFCELPEIQQRTIVRNELAWAFPTNIPIVPGHVIIAPIRCVPTVEDLTSQELQSIFALQRMLKPALTETFGAEGFNYAWNEGSEAGQVVPHFHLQMLPRKKGDEGITGYEPRTFLYRPGSVEVHPESELQSVAKQITQALT